ncbi:ABC transporter permease [Candidatus Bipolaricaulota bacterium]|nr:ABC transporter permease [Candidatus Bipolaricaulota bacterium]
MPKYIIRRLLQLIPTLIGVSIITFLLMQLAPGGPTTAILGMKATPEKIAYINKKFGLDKPIPLQYLIWLKNLIFNGDLGNSIVENEPVLRIILRRIPVTFQLAISSLMLSLCISLPAGIVSAVKKDTWFDNVARIFAFWGISTPNFWLGLLLIIGFGVMVPVLPVYGYVGIFENFVQGVRHMILPAITLGTALAAMVTRMTRSSLLETLNEDYIRTARAKGLTERVVISKHAIKNAMIPVTTVVGLQLGYILGGSVLTETVFALPGMGRLMIRSIFKQDYPVVQGAVLVYALTFVLVNLLVDLSYAYLDPKIRLD